MKQSLALLLITTAFLSDNSRSNKLHPHSDEAVYNLFSHHSREAVLAPSQFHERLGYILEEAGPLQIQQLTSPVRVGYTAMLHYTTLSGEKIIYLTNCEPNAQQHSISLSSNGFSTGASEFAEMIHESPEGKEQILAANRKLCGVLRR